jgi:hypothetical protein
LSNKEQHDVRPHTPYKQHSSKYLPTPKRNVRALQPMKVKIDRRVMCPWGGEKRNDATAGGAKKTVSVVRGTP